MARGGLISRVSGLIAGASQPWRPDPPYPSLFDLGAHRRDLDDNGGVYVLWHLGVKPRWLRASHSVDLGASFAALAGLAQVASCRPNGGVFVAWSAAPVARRAGIVRHLADRLRPVFQTLTIAGESASGEALPIDFPLPPGTQDLTAP